MPGDTRDPFALAKFLIELNGIDRAIEIARANGWRSVLAQCLVLKPALTEQQAATVH